MSSFIKIMLLLALLVAGMAVISNACFVYVHIHVQITNKLENGEDLTLHCKSKDDDLGVHLLHRDESYRFRFCPHLLGKTLFFCSFVWSGQVHWFDIYNGKKDNCHYCNWRITHSAACDDKGCYQYNNNPPCMNKNE